MKRYQLLNNVVGWLAFAISAVTYILTTEDSASFWDCGEFIATADKLLVGHPPGAPFFMIVARMFAIVAPNTQTVAQMINIMSALASAFTILFLCWTITHLGRRIFIDNVENAEPWRVWAVLGAGLVGSLAYTFSDTFWFSAVEGEVYAMSSLFTAVVFWAILKWEDSASEPQSNRWIILIAYLMGLSIGVHLLNLLAIPAIVVVYYFKNYTVTRARTVWAVVISAALLGGILYGIIPGIVKVATWFELFAVNNLHWGFNVGSLIYALLLVAAVIYGIWYTYVHNHVIANTIITGVAVIILGYSSFAMVVIRSVANPTMDQNSPEDVFALQDYLNREQYGDRPLFYGQSFNSPLDRAASDYKARPIYIRKGDRYVISDYRPDYKYDAKTTMLLPRMYSRDERHIREYKSWTNFKGRPVQVADEENGGYKTIYTPTMGENLKFLWNYQIKFMYWRYFMWNFCGRQNDIQGHGELIHGNWLSGIPLIDDMLYGDQDLLPDTLKNNKGRNVYFMLPFLLGLAGMFFQFGRGREGKHGFVIVMLLFFMTGLAIVLYLNQTPLQPRERDYAYAGSFYAYAIWIGLGVLGAVEFLRKRLPGNVSAVAATLICLVAVPGVMAQQNWDDHDRSGRTIARDLAYNYLNSCDENAILFTNGDNDTFPLWYAQEVEGIRTDVRVCNLSYLQTGWYVDQMKRKAYLSDPLPISFTHDQYTGDRDVIYLIPKLDRPIELSDAMKFVASDIPATKRLAESDERICYIPSRKFKLTVDPDSAVAGGAVSERKRGEIDSVMTFTLNKSYIFKNELMVLDMLVNAGWKRPIYYAVTVGSENYCGLQNYFQLEGLTYRVVPIRGKRDASGQSGTVDTDRIYTNVMEKFRWGFYNKPGIYLDENTMRMATNLRNNLTRMADALIDEGKTDSAVTVLDKTVLELPSSAIPHNYFSLLMARSYYRCHQMEKGDAILDEYATDLTQELTYYQSLSPSLAPGVKNDQSRCIALFTELYRLASEFDRAELVDKLESGAAAISVGQNNYY